MGGLPYPMPPREPLPAELALTGEQIRALSGLKRALPAGAIVSDLGDGLVSFTEHAGRRRTWKVYPDGLCIREPETDDAAA